MQAGEQAGRQPGSLALSIQTCRVRTMVATKLQIDLEGQLPMRERGAGGSVWTKCDWGWSVVISASLGLSPGLDTKEAVGVG